MLRKEEWGLVKVKICGLTNVEDACKAVEYGADLLGFIFVPGTPRYVGRDAVRDIVEKCRMLSDKVLFTGLFRDEELEKVAGTVFECGLNSVQLQGEEPPIFCSGLKKLARKKFNWPLHILKAFKVRNEVMTAGAYSIADYAEVDYFVFDTFHSKASGGTGLVFDWRILREEKNNIYKPFFIAGGLTPENVEDAVKSVCPYGVDVSSGVEKSPGRKDHKRLKEFISNAKKK
ncbi:MAG: phosphoribosylanthranilate isomerase [Candidatus Omnitrophota bacterium]